MVTRTVEPLVLKDADVLIGADNYKKHISGVTFTPNSTTNTWQGLDPTESWSDATTATWTAVLNYVQDWDTEDSLSRFLLENEGERLVMVFTPRSGEGSVITATVTITPGAIGGEVNAFATTSVTLGSTRPVETPFA